MGYYNDEFDLYPIVREWFDRNGSRVKEQVKYGRSGGRGVVDIVVYDKHKGALAIEVKVRLADALPQAILCHDAFDYSYIALPTSRLTTQGWASNYVTEREVWALQQLGIGLLYISNDKVKEVIKAKKTKRPYRKKLTRKINILRAESFHW